MTCKFKSTLADLMMAKGSEARVICDLKDGDKNMQKDTNTKVHSCLKHCLQDFCLTQKSYTFTKTLRCD